jgi:hypothetical protein
MEKMPNYISMELMEILTKINSNISEVKERLAGLEAQDHSNSIRTVMLEVEKEREHRIKLEIELANIKTKLAPLIAAISIAGAGAIQLVIQNFRA